MGAKEPFRAVADAEGDVSITEKILTCTTTNPTQRTGTHNNDTGLDGCLYFYWGETEGHHVNENYQLVAENGFTYGANTKNGTKGNNPMGEFRKNTSATLLSQIEAEYLDKRVEGGTTQYFLNKRHDAAYQHLGGGWQMLGNKEMSELIYKLVGSYTTIPSNNTLHAIVYKSDDNMIHGCDCGTIHGNFLVEGRAIGYELSRKDLSPLVRLPMAGCVLDKSLKATFDTHDYGDNGDTSIPSAIFSYTWSRDFDEKNSKAYCYGYSQFLTRTEDRVFWNNSDYSQFVDTGFPILPCLIVKVKKQKASQE